MNEKTSGFCPQFLCRPGSRVAGRSYTPRRQTSARFKSNRNLDAPGCFDTAPLAKQIARMPHSAGQMRAPVFAAKVAKARTHLKG
jgi:hypothetical protein